MINLIGVPAEKESGLRQAVRRKEVWLIALAQAGVMGTFNTFTIYLPVYFEQIIGFDTAATGSITGFLPLIGIVGGLICGMATGAIGLRKPFLWPMHILMLIGAIGSVIIPSRTLLYLSVGLLGFGAAGWTPVFMTIPMELEGANPEMVGGSFAIINGCGSMAAYFAPVAFGLLVPRMGMYSTLFAFGFSTMLSIICTVIIPETGPRSKKKKGKAECNFRHSCKGTGLRMVRSFFYVRRRFPAN